MDEPSIQYRLSQISTAWTMIARAHGTGGDPQLMAQNALVERYHQAVYRYLCGATRDPDAADELFQEFALRFVRGDFRNADPGRGRFRDFLKTSLINLVLTHRRKQGRAMPTAPEGHDPAAPAPDTFNSDEEFLAGWRKALLDKAWEGLAALQKPGGPPFHATLRLRTERPEMSSAQMAEALNEQLRPASPYTEAGVRKILQRARDLFTDLVVDEVARSLVNPTPDELEQEVIDLGFQAYCKKALERRRAGNAP